MSGIDKNQALIDYLSNCPIIQNNTLFFNFAEECNNSVHIISPKDKTERNEEYIDGTSLKTYTPTIFVYKSVSYNPTVKATGYPNENVVDLSEVQALIDWIDTQNEQKVFPNFGNSCIIESVETQTNTPVLNGVNVKSQPALAQYGVTIQITYLDTSKKIWN